MTAELTKNIVDNDAPYQQVRLLVDNSMGQDKLILESLSVHIYLLLKNGPKAHGQHSFASKAKHSLRMTMDLVGNNITGSKKTGAVCFYADHPGQIDQALPVYKELVLAGVNAVFFVHKSTLYKLLRKEGIKAVLIPISFFKIEQGLSPSWAKPFLSNDDNWFDEQLIEQIERLSLANYVLPQLIHFAQNWVAQYKPLAFVSGYDLNPACRAMTLPFKAAGLPTFCIQHGTINSDPLMVKSHVVDHFLAFGEVTKQSLLSSGAAYEIHVTGAPYLKNALENAKLNKSKMASIMPGQQFDNMVLIAFSGAGHGTSKAHLDQQIRAVLALAKRHPSIGFTFKLHPKDKKENYSEALKAANCFIVMNSDFTSQAPGIFDWLNRCSAVVTGASTVAMEALLVGKPVFTIDLNEEYTNIDFIKVGATVHADASQMFIDNFGKWLEEPTAHAASFENGKRFIESFFANKSDAAERCASVILEEAQKSKQMMAKLP